MLLYICGIYLIVTGSLAFMVRKKENRCCTLVYAGILPPVFILMVISAIPIFMVNSVDEATIDKLCEAAAGDAQPLKVDAKKDGRLLGTSDEMKAKVSKKWTSLKDSGMNKGE